MNNKELRSISFFLSRSLFLGSATSTIFTLSNKDAWLSCILGILLGIVIIYLLNYFNKSIKGDLKKYLSKKNIINYLIKIIFLLISITIILVSLISLTSLISTYFLPFTPPFIISITFIILIIYTIKKGIISFNRILIILFPICFFLIILKIILLTPEININYYLPIITNPISKILASSVIFSIISTIPFFLIIEELNNLKRDITNYLIGSITGSIIIFSLTGVLGNVLLTSLNNAEYAVLRNINFLDFVENIENIFAFTWLVEQYVLISSASFNIVKITNKKITYFILIILVLIYNLLIFNNIEHNIFIYSFISLSILTILLLLIKKTSKE